MIKKLLYILLITGFCHIGGLWAATYNYYFSDDAAGNDAGNDSNSCLDGTTNACKTLQKAENVMKVLLDTDVVNLYFDRGDTWNFATNVLEVFSVEAGDPVVHIKAYGSGARPIFQGDIPDFSDPSVEVDNTDNWHRYNRVFHFEVENCSVDNVEIKDVYGAGVFLDDADGFTLSNSLIHNVGASFIDTRGSPGGENVTVEYNELHTGMQLHLYDLYGTPTPMFSQGISLFQEDGGPYRNNLIQYNLVYDVAGEGISAPNSIIQYNVVGDTSSTGIDSSPAAWDASTGVVRYNLVIMSDWSSSDYDNLGGTPNGIRIFDEKVGGDNSGADFSVYGNIIINRGYGIWVFSSQDTGNPFGSVKIYNNLVIDSRVTNVRIANPDEFTYIAFYNNALVQYDQTDEGQIDSVEVNESWDISHNLIYNKDYSPDCGSGTNQRNGYWDCDFNSNPQTTDPLLPGETLSIDWDGLTGSDYYDQIDVTTHLYPPTDSSLVGNGMSLGTGYNFLTTGNDFEDVLTGSIGELVAQSGAWDIGAVIRSTATAPAIGIGGAVIMGGKIN